MQPAGQLQSLFAVYLPLGNVLIFFDRLHQRPAMERKSIRLESNAILPVTFPTWYKADEKLLEARTGLQEMQGAQERATYERGWVRFAESIQEAWVRFRIEGEKVSKEFSGWYQPHRQQREADPLLAYMYQFRNECQHGIPQLDWTEPHLQVASGFNGHIRSLQVFPDWTFQFESQATPGSRREAEVAHFFGRPRLPTLFPKKPKGAEPVPPPRVHLGNSIDGLEPDKCAELVLAYHTGLLTLAKLKFT